MRVRLADLHVNGRLDLYRSCTDWLASSNKPGEDAESITRTLRRGAYQVRVTSPNDGRSSIPYSLLFRLLPR